MDVKVKRKWNGTTSQQQRAADAHAAGWQAVASWKWKINDTDCGICRQPFDGFCSDCKYPGDECPPVWGECKHAFHMCGSRVVAVSKRLRCTDAAACARQQALHLQVDERAEQLESVPHVSPALSNRKIRRAMMIETDHQS